jgi:hypothetical protein
MINFLGPASLAAGEDASGLEIFEVFVVSDDLEGLSEALEIMSPELDPDYNGEEFLVMDLLVALRWRHLARHEGYRMEEPIGEGLRDYGGDSVVGGVGLDDGF